MKRAIYTALLTALPLFGLVGCTAEEDEAINASDPALPDEPPETDSDYVGLNTQQAETRAFRRAQPFRYSIIDGEPQAGTLDDNPNRLNFTVERDVIIAVSRG